MKRVPLSKLWLKKGTSIWSNVLKAVDFLSKCDSYWHIIKKKSRCTPFLVLYRCLFHRCMICQNITSDPKSESLNWASVQFLTWCGRWVNKLVPLNINRSFLSFIHSHILEPRSRIQGALFKWPGNIYVHIHYSRETKNRCLLLVEGLSCYIWSYSYVCQSVYQRRSCEFIVLKSELPFF